MLENRGHTFAENAMILKFAKMQRKTLMFVEVELLKFLFGIENCMSIRFAYFVSISVILDYARFNKRFKGQRDRRLSNFYQIN